MSPLTLCSIQNSIARITLNSVKKRNALSFEMLQELQSHFMSIQSNPSVHVVILNANGPAFSSGHDLKEIQKHQSHKQEEELQKTMQLCSSIMQSIPKLKAPVIAQIDGVATAAGCQLVASCDLAYASKTSKFGTPGVNIGLFCSTPGVALGRTVHRKHAMQMLLTGDLIDAQQAQEIGLINAAVDRVELEEMVEDVAVKIASKSPMAIEMGKQVFYQQLELPLDQAYQLTSDVMVSNLKEQDAVEGINAFLAKRKPEWSRRD